METGAAGVVAIHAGAAPIRRIVHLGFVALIDAVPLAGVLHFGWSVSACLIVFWCENLLSGLLMTARLCVHQMLTRDPHYGRSNGAFQIRIGNGKAKPLKFQLPAAFAVATGVFTLTHGFFVFFLVSLLGGLPASVPGQWGMDSAWLPLLKGIGLMTGFQLLDFLHDLIGIRNWPFAFVKGLADRQLNRVVILHLGIIFGGFAIVLAQVQSVAPILLAVLSIKLLTDLATERRTTPINRSP